eukprot:TRINITY_DN3547_c0_g2_i1.p1 TRINITY_DN3547_c0_g2~~TRINITY_DN3547_c0_g2_i1.p1  ORF type:complete len:685 (+),score=128.81 TRINITY_DN3547_c0_g2_i1:68-2056(+)
MAPREPGMAVGVGGGQAAAAVAGGGQAAWSAWTPADVRRWIAETLRLPQYGAAFERQGVDGPTLLELTERELETELGVANAIHRKKVVAHAKLLRGPETAPAGADGISDADGSTSTSTPQQRGLDAGQKAVKACETVSWMSLWNARGAAGALGAAPTVAASGAPAAAGAHRGSGGFCGLPAATLPRQGGVVLTPRTAHAQAQPSPAVVDLGSGSAGGEDTASGCSTIINAAAPPRPMYGQQELRRRSDGEISLAPNDVVRYCSTGNGSDVVWFTTTPRSDVDVVTPIHSARRHSQPHNDVADVAPALGGGYLRPCRPAAPVQPQRAFSSERYGAGGVRSMPSVPVVFAPRPAAGTQPGHYAQGCCPQAQPLHLQHVVQRQVSQAAPIGAPATLTTAPPMLHASQPLVHPQPQQQALPQQHQQQPHQQSQQSLQQEQPPAQPQPRPQVYPPAMERAAAVASRAPPPEAVAMTPPPRQERDEELRSLERGTSPPMRTATPGTTTTRALSRNSTPRRGFQALSVAGSSDRRARSRNGSPRASPLRGQGAATFGRAGMQSSRGCRDTMHPGHGSRSLSPAPGVYRNSMQAVESHLPSSPRAVIGTARRDNALRRTPGGPEPVPYKPCAQHNWSASKLPGGSISQARRFNYGSAQQPTWLNKGIDGL